MKLFSPILILFLALPLAMNLSKTEKRLVGTWQCTNVDFSEMLAGMNDDDKAMYQAFLPMMEEIFLSFKMTFKNDYVLSTEVASGADVSVEEGTWALSADGKTMTTTTNGSSSDISIQSLTSKEMILLLESEGMKMKMTMTKSKTKKK
jgi:hypothetical protein